MSKPWDRGGLRTYLLVLALLFGRPEQLVTLWGLPLLLSGLALHVYAKGSLLQNQLLAQGGPYRFVRHPFYAANLLIDEGIALMSGWLPLILLLPVWWLAVYLPVMRGEERHLGTLFPTVYPSYRDRVPMLLPLRRPLARQSAGFSWRNPNIVADTVIPRALRILTLPVLFSLWRALRADGVRVFADGHSAISLLTMVLAVAYGLSWELTCHLKHRRRILPSAITRDTARLAGAALVVGVAGLAHSWEIESPVAVALIGITGFAVSIVLYLLRPQNLLLAEGIALTATAVLCEVVWLVPAPVLLCSALILDERLARSAQQPAPLEQSKLLRPVYANLYLVLVSAGMLVALAKEVLG